MKNKKNKAPSRQQGTVLRQLVDCIPTFLVSKLAGKYGVESKARSFSTWSHVVAMLYGQLTHALSLNDICDALRMWATPLRALRGATAPSRNGLSHANKVRDWQLARDLFWEVLKHLEQRFSGFGRGMKVGRRRWSGPCPAGSGSDPERPGSQDRGRSRQNSLPSGSRRTCQRPPS